MKDKDRLILQSHNPNELSFKRIRQAEYPDVDRALQMWILQNQGRNLRITGDVIQAKARDFATAFGHPSDFLSLSNGWLTSLKERMGLRQHHYHGEAASAPVDTLAAEIARIRAFRDTYDDNAIFNFDESASFYRMAPDKGLATQQMSGVKSDKTRITFGVAANMDGSEKLPLLIIGHAKQPRAFGKKSGKQLKFDYWWNKKAWMTTSIWQGWLANLNKLMKKQKRKILLLCDNAPSHIHDQKKYSNVRIEHFAPNLTAWIQPNDAGIIQCLKSYYKQAFIYKVIERDNQGEKNIYKINQLEAMNMLRDAWEQVSSTTIANCWRHTKISGPAPEEAVTAFSVPTVANEVNEAVASLQHTLNSAGDRIGPLGPMHAHKYLAIDATVPTEQEWSDQEIVEQIQEELKQTKAEARGEIIYDDDDDDNEDNPSNGVAHKSSSPRVDSPAAAIASIDALKSFLSRLDDPGFDSNMVQLDDLCQQIASFGV
ncbi:DDE superfamily endonuclease [Rhizoctonia solani 123E]|uniref:DDE superfamily endonuclease n=1 Tax=Rhizoctonia solani 123E TaxID=1423351 RepID=A0A074RUG4_9AGAM|nr:DDE superfamily endonuclease [Rhizoctonia solani 123E]